MPLTLLPSDGPIAIRQVLVKPAQERSGLVTHADLERDRIGVPVSHPAPSRTIALEERLNHTGILRPIVIGEVGKFFKRLPIDDLSEAVRPGADGSEFLLCLDPSQAPDYSAWQAVGKLLQQLLASHGVAAEV